MTKEQRNHFKREVKKFIVEHNISSSYMNQLKMQGITLMKVIDDYPPSMYFNFCPRVMRFADLQEKWDKIVLDKGLTVYYRKIIKGEV